MAATLQRKSPGGIIFAIITKIITKENVLRNYFVIISARMVLTCFTCPFFPFWPPTACWHSSFTPFVGTFSRFSPLQTCSVFCVKRGSQHRTTSGWASPQSSGRKFLPPKSAWKRVSWSAANGVLRDGGLSKSEDIWGKRPFFLRFLEYPGVVRGRRRQKTDKKGRFRLISRKGGQTPLKPPFLTPPFAAPQVRAKHGLKEGYLTLTIDRQIVWDQHQMWHACHPLTRSPTHLASQGVNLESFFPWSSFACFFGSAFSFARNSCKIECFPLSSLIFWGFRRPGKSLFFCDFPFCFRKSKEKKKEVGRFWFDFSKPTKTRLEIREGQWALFCPPSCGLRNLQVFGLHDLIKTD